MPSYNGTTGNDTLRGSAGDDNISGLSGNDTLQGLGGADWLVGGDGDDLLLGGEGTDIISGGAGDDILWGGGYGNTGIVIPDQVRDDLDGGDGADSFIIGRLDVALGGNGDDHFEIEEEGTASFRATMDGGAGDDFVDFGFVKYRPVIYLDPTGTPADGFTLRSVELLALGNFGARVYGGSAADAVVGGNGVDEIEGGAGNDLLSGENGNDIISGGDGDDVIFAGQGSDRLRGGAGADIFVYLTAAESTQIQQYDPQDIIEDFQTGIDQLDLTAMRPTSVAIRQEGPYSIVTAQTANGVFAIRVNGAVASGDVIPSFAGAQINGTAASDILIGTNGNDTLTGGAGADTLTGGAGTDVFRYLATSDSTAADQDTIADFQLGDTIDLTALNATSISVARLNGASVVYAQTPGGAFQLFANGAALNASDFTYTGSFGVYVIGSDNADTIVGSSRPDPLVGNGGDDIITGGAGADAIAGGSGRDVFRYVVVGDSSPNTGFDNLYDFVTAEDRIDLSLLNPTSISILRSDNGSSFVYAETFFGSFLTTAAGRAVNGTDFIYSGGFGIYMVGSGVSDVLTGTSRADPIAGGGGDDLIIGGGGADAMFGVAGADTFIYMASADSTAAATDGIFGFVSGTDRLDLTRVRTGSADTFGIAYTAQGGSFLFVDLGGNGSTDMVIGLANTTLVAGDIVWGAGGLGQEASIKDTGPQTLPGADETVLFDGDPMSDMRPMTGRYMLDLEGQRGFHGQDWYL